MIEFTERDLKLLHKVINTTNVEIPIEIREAYYKLFHKKQEVNNFKIYPLSREAIDEIEKRIVKKYKVVKVIKIVSC